MWYFGLIQHFYIAHMLSCSPANILNINVSIVFRVLKMSQEKLKKTHVHFFFLEGGEVTGAGGRKRRIKMVDG